MGFHEKRRGSRMLGREQGGGDGGGRYSRDIGSGRNGYRYGRDIMIVHFRCVGGRVGKTRSSLQD